MSDVLVWIPGVFPDTRPLWPTQVSTVINLHRSKLPRIPNEGGKGSVWWCRRKKERKNEENRGQRRREKEVEVTLAGNSGGAGRRKQNTIDEDSDGS